MSRPPIHGSLARDQPYRDLFESLCRFVVDLDPQQPLYQADLLGLLDTIWEGRPDARVARAMRLPR